MTSVSLSPRTVLRRFDLIEGDEEGPTYVPKFEELDRALRPVRLVGVDRFDNRAAGATGPEPRE